MKRKINKRLAKLIESGTAKKVYEDWKKGYSIPYIEDTYKISRYIIERCVEQNENQL